MTRLPLSSNGSKKLRRNLNHRRMKLRLTLIQEPMSQESRKPQLNLRRKILLLSFRRNRRRRVKKMTKTMLTLTTFKENSFQLCRNYSRFPSFWHINVGFRIPLTLQHLIAPGFFHGRVDGALYYLETLCQ